jgi:prepilin-type N-terminal cleavage/methylation domain-containing protein
MSNLGATMQSNNPTTRRRSSAGFSLVEMLVVIALSAMVMGVVVSLMLELRQWDRLCRVKNTRNEQLLRLSTTLRSDIRRGNDVLLSVAGPLVVMTASGEQFRYELGPEGCRRTVVTRDDPVPRDDLFAIGRASKWNVERRPAGRRPLLSVTIENGEVRRDPAAPRLIPFLVYASLGADEFQQAAARN